MTKNRDTMKEPTHAFPIPDPHSWVEGLDGFFSDDLPSIPQPEIGEILVTGASGYIGGRLVPELLHRGYRVRAMVRADAYAYPQSHPNLTVIQADVMDPQSLIPAMQGIHTAYYLIHSLLLGPKDFYDADTQAALHFREMAQKMGLQRIVYLGGMDAQNLNSTHLQSRADVARELAAGSVPVTILRAAIIIGSGSASYEIIHSLVKTMPLLFLPRWSRNKCQPISIRDVVKYLIGVLEIRATIGHSYDIGGKNIMTYELMLKVFASIISRKIIFVSSPISNIRLLSFLTSLLTPVPAQITACLMEGLQDEVVCRNSDIRTLIPFETLSYKQAIVRALTREDQDKVATRWSDAYPPAHELAMKLTEVSSESLYRASYSLKTEKTAVALYRAVCVIGGKSGWFYSNWLWWTRGMIDRLFFGVGSARGRKRQFTLHINDVLDFWRVEDMRVNERLLLRAEMKLPGKAWLEFVIQEEEGKRRFRITAFFHTRTLFGKAYWYAFWPFHYFIFNGLIEQIEARS
jgi:uncharacterized protein YbjT (DUF2867 family)